MKEFIEKLIGMLEEEKQRLRNLKNDCVALSDHEVIAIEEGAYNFCKEIVNQLAEEYINTSTDTSSGWISVKDSLPSDEKEYLVTLRDGDVTSAKYDKEEIVWVDPVEEYCEYPVIAWQNTPAPYKEGE